MKRRGYRATVEWIALNDEPNETNVGWMTSLISVILAAFVFGKDPGDVASDVVRFRRRNDTERV